MGVRVAVAGASGYAGGELLRLISGHPDLEIGPLSAGASAGMPVTDVHPHLPALAGRVFGPADPASLAAADLVFLALPHGESAALAAALPGHVAVVDLSASFRLADPQAWARYYRTGHAGCWVYGLPELPGARERISAARRVASPGCYATAAILALAPLLAAGLAEPQDIVIVAASGTSGAGRSPSAGAAGDRGDGRGVGVPGGRDAPAHARDRAGAAPRRGGMPRRPSVSFTPMLAPMPRGILATCTARLTGAVHGTPRVRAALADAYAGEPFVRVLPEGRWPTTAATVGSNGAHLQAPPTPMPGGPWWSPRSTTWARARPARPSRRPTSCSACRRRRA